MINHFLFLQRGINYATAATENYYLTKYNYDYSTGWKGLSPSFKICLYVVWVCMCVLLCVHICVLKIEWQSLNTNSVHCISYLTLKTFQSIKYNNSKWQFSLNGVSSVMLLWYIILHSYSLRLYEFIDNHEVCHFWTFMPNLS